MLLFSLSLSLSLSLEQFLLLLAFLLDMSLHVSDLILNVVQFFMELLVLLRLFELSLSILSESWAACIFREFFILFVGASFLLSLSFEQSLLLFFVF